MSVLDGRTSTRSSSERTGANLPVLKADSVPDRVAHYRSPFLRVRGLASQPPRLEFARQLRHDLPLPSGRGALQRRRERPLDGVTFSNSLPTLARLGCAAMLGHVTRCVATVRNRSLVLARAASVRV
jgi:hypothetical protein